MDQENSKPSIGSYGRKLMDDCIYVLLSPLPYTGDLPLVSMDGRYGVMTATLE